jgi:hypothetical protein
MAESSECSSLTPPRSPNHPDDPCAAGHRRNRLGHRARHEGRGAARLAGATSGGPAGRKIRRPGRPAGPRDRDVVLNKTMERAPRGTYSTRGCRKCGRPHDLPIRSLAHLRFAMAASLPHATRPLPLPRPFPWSPPDSSPAAGRQTGKPGGLPPPTGPAWCTAGTHHCRAQAGGNNRSNG